jgi:hypothetical protein
MKKQKDIEQTFIIDRLTDSIFNTISGDSFRTEVSILTKTDLKNITTKNRWNFDWKAELNDLKKETYKLTIVDNPDIVQGLLSIRRQTDHIFMNLLENAPFNIGKEKLYEGVAGNLVAFACKLSFQLGFEGFVAFTAKTKLIKHYEESLEASNIGGQKMIIPTHSAKKLVDKYFKTK